MVWVLFGVIREEIGAKPWCHSTHLGEKESAEVVEGNEVMRPYKCGILEVLCDIKRGLIELFA